MTAIPPSVVLGLLAAAVSLPAPAAGAARPGPADPLSYVTAGPGPDQGPAVELSRLPGDFTFGQLAQALRQTVLSPDSPGPTLAAPGAPGAPAAPGSPGVPGITPTTAPTPGAGAGAAAPTPSAVPGTASGPLQPATGAYLTLGIGLALIGCGVALVGVRLRRR